MGQRLREEEIQRQIVTYLQVMGWYVEITDAGAGRRGGGRWGTLSLGYPDLTAFKNGRVLLIECKSPEGKLSSHQVAKHAEIRACGTSVYVCRSLDEAIVAEREAYYGGKKD
ncbi:VRR-NUC domain-containing protein [Meiothermus granaticius]|uniref:VRR-NUC domain protein n=1 Tax=Meiothermus granaticius NBRC 107808 TaxID=1227551 RepID=A0A399FBN5_9DEIN|nr:VRR-NUC domain-containing protein [Meiothermus granaticius]RIH94014.1 VRR-NUC domain protein [Meiothermus granaticius NBRC 107808]GEM88157.1 hypothetical protein MGR01S_27820 [Meiothermus granaticius NBRC 107808]